MDLLPQAAVERFTSEHEDALGAVWGCLDQAVPKAYAKWDLEFPDARDLPGGTLATDSRTLFWPRVQVALRGKSLHVCQQGPSWRLVDAFGTTVRLRKLPPEYRWNHYLSKPPSVTPPSIDTLFGADESILDGWEYVILWSPSPSSQSLETAVLAAATGLKTSETLVIYAETPLPRQSLLTDTLPADASRTQPTHESGFDDFFGETGTAGTGDLA